MIVAVDFDGTLCVGVWPEIGAPNMRLIERLKTLKEEGHKLILWTNRVDGERPCLSEAVKWCAGYGLTFDAINDNLPEIIKMFGSNSRKITADLYIDDKNACDVICLKYGIPYTRQMNISETILSDEAEQYRKCWRNTLS